MGMIIEGSDDLLFEEICKRLPRLGYKLIIQNNCKEYKMKYFTELMDEPMNAVWIS